jgi:hypothetical protein
MICDLQACATTTPTTSTIAVANATTSFTSTSTCQATVDCAAEDGDTEFATETQQDYSII